MKRTFFICLIFFILVSSFQSGTFPGADITNGLIKAHLYLPDNSKGFYRATRFDWSGLVSNLEYKGHNFYGQWFARYSPESHESVMGPVEEFAPIGYGDAGSGQTFVKIGVGVLTKPEEHAYNSFKLYKIVNPGTWKTKTRSDQVQFTHTLNDTEYSYKYRKIIRLTKGKPEMVISHSLKNTGKKLIETTVYNHNFPVIDNQPTGPGFIIRFPVAISGQGQGTGEVARIDGNNLIFLKDMISTDKVYWGELKGFSDDARDYDMRIENTTTGAGIRIRGDRPVSKMVFWASPTTVCPEPYIDVKVEPGEEFNWKITYEYYTFQTGNQK